MSQITDGAMPSGRCVLLISSPTDSVVYRCFQVIAQRWSGKVTGEALSLDGGVPLRPGLAQRDAPSSVRTIIAADADVIGTLVLEFGGLKVSYVRSGGSGPVVFRESFFDEVRLEASGEATLSRDELRELAAIVCGELGADAATGTPEFAALTDALPLKVRAFDAEPPW